MVKFTLLLLLILTQINIESDVKIFGSLHSIMQGDLSAHFDLRDLEHQKHVYGLGSVAGFKGEFVIVDSKPYIATVQDSSLVINQNFNSQAAMIVYGQVANWKEFKLRNVPSDLSEFEKEMDHFALENQLQDKIITVLINGPVNALDWHVVNWNPEDKVHTHKKHKESGLHGTIKNKNVTLVGFFSTKHKGIISHMNSNIHLHFVNDNKTIAGHVDGVSFSKDAHFYMAE